MKKKNKPRSNLPYVETMLIGFCFVMTLWLGMILAVLVDVSSNPITEEQLKIPADSGIPKYTQNKYSGWVTITISGTAKANVNFYRNALYYSEKVDDSRYFNGFFVDGAYAFIFGVPSKYAENHVYRLLYYAGYEPRNIEFQIINKIGLDLTDEFTIEVSNENKVTSGGR